MKNYVDIEDLNKTVLQNELLKYASDVHVLKIDLSKPLLDLSEYDPYSSKPAVVIVAGLRNVAQLEAVEMTNGHTLEKQIVFEVPGKITWEMEKQHDFSDDDGKLNIQVDNNSAEDMA